MLLAKGILHNDLSLYFYVCVFLKIFGAKKTKKYPSDSEFVRLDKKKISAGLCECITEISNNHCRPLSAQTRKTSQSISLFS